jgi:hypothetical protein
MAVLVRRGGSKEQKWKKGSARHFRDSNRVNDLPYLSGPAGRAGVLLATPQKPPEIHAEYPKYGGNHTALARGASTYRL